MEISLTKRTTFYLLGLLAVNLIVLSKNDFLYIGALFTFVYVILAPGLLILPFLVEKKLPWSLGFALGGSLGALILTLLGLISNTVLPLAGITTRPLETLPLLAMLDIFIIMMLGLSLLSRKDSAFAKPEIKPFDKWAIFFAIMLPIMATTGAIILTNGGSNAIAMTTLGLIAALVMIVIGGKAKLKTSSFAILLYGITVAILLMTSMRGYYLTGHDVQLEYQVFSLTNRLKFWDMGNFQDAYNACLSITILPTYLQSLLHVQDFYIYKFFFQFISAFLAIIIFYLSRHFTTDKVAFLSSLAYLTFPTFVVDMAMLNRQGMALMFFGGLVLVLLTDGYFKGKKRNLLLLLFGTGMILSHYSTSYITVAILIGGYFIDVLMRILFWIRRPRALAWIWDKTGNTARRKQPKLLQLPVTIGLVIVLAVWTGPVTATSQNLTNTLKQIAFSLENPFKKDVNAGPKKYSLTNAQQMTKDELFALYIEEEIQKSRTDASEEEFYSTEITSQYKKFPIDEPVLPLNPIGQKTEDILASPLKGLYNETKQFYAKIMQIFIFISLLSLLLGYKFMGHLKKDVPTEYIALCSAGILVMVMQIVLPQSVIDYGLLRLFQQNLVLLALPVTLGFLSAFGLIVRRRKTRLIFFSGFLMAFFLVFSGFIPQVTGGGRPMITLNNQGFYYDAYYIHGGEMDALLWLKELSIDNPVQSDRYFSNVRLLSYSDIGAHTKILPEVTLKDAIVYLSHTNATDKTVIEFIDGDVLYYKLPIEFFDDNKNLIYDSGQSRVYK